MGKCRGGYHYPSGYCRDYDHTTKIPVMFYQELKPGEVVRYIEDDGVKLLLVNGKSIGTVRAVITNVNGRTYLVWTQKN